MDGLFTVLKEYQSGLGALVGFAGVIVTLFVNAALARRSQQRLREHERSVLRNALLAELTRLRDGIKGNTEQLKPVIERLGGVEFYLHDMMLTKMYDRVLDKIGLLSADEAQKVIVAYAQAKLLPSQVQLLKIQHKIKIDPLDRFGENMIHVPAAISADLISMQENQLDQFDAAIKALSKPD